MKLQCATAELRDAVQLLQPVSAAITKAELSEPEPQEIIHNDQILAVLDRAACDAEFVAALYFHGADALDEYDLTGPEKLALLTADVTSTWASSVCVRPWLVPESDSSVRDSGLSTKSGKRAAAAAPR